MKCLKVRRTLPVTAVVACSLLLVSASSAGTAQKTWIIDAKRSCAVFQVAHVFIDDVSGRLPLNIDRAKFSIIGKLIQTMKSALHRRANDRDGAWFSIEHYAAWKFTGSRFRKGLGGLQIDGELTMHEASTPISFVAQIVPSADGRRHYHATAIVERHIFEMHLAPAQLLSGDTVRIELDVFLQQRYRDLPGVA